MKKNKKQSATGTMEQEKSHQLKKFFIVDDDEYYNNILQSYIKKIGKEMELPIETSFYLNGSDCLSDIGHNPDYVILDFYLDENNDITLTGYDVLEKIKKYNRNIKVIVISQMHEWANFKEEFMESGATDFLKKDDELYENLKRIVQQNVGMN